MGIISPLLLLPGYHQKTIRSFVLPGGGVAANGKGIFYLVGGATNYLQKMIGLKPQEKVFILCDPQKEKIAQAFGSAASTLGASNVDIHNIGEERFTQAGIGRIISRITPQAEHFINEGDYVALYESLKNKTPFPFSVSPNYNLFINLLEMRTDIKDEAKQRIRVLMTEKILSKASTLSRVAHAPLITEELVCHALDFEEMHANAKRIEGLLDGADRVEVKTKAGTNISIKIAGRKPVIDVLLKLGQMCNLPSGEIFVSPLEDGADGVIIVDGSTGVGGLLPTPLRIKVEKGKITEIGWVDESRGDSIYLAKIKNEIYSDAWASIIGELGIGLALFILNGNLLQDEKALKTIHIAFGQNITEGGKNASGTHLDFVIRCPDLTIYYSKESGKQPFKMMEEGNFLF